MPVSMVAPFPLFIRFGAAIETVLKFPPLAKGGRGEIWNAAQIVSSETTNRITCALQTGQESYYYEDTPGSAGIPACNSGRIFIIVYEHSSWCLLRIKVHAFLILPGITDNSPVVYCWNV
jgi:hypothetical protein